MIKLIYIDRNLISNLIVSLGSVTLFRLISLATGKITVNEGLGYDGIHYAKMLTEGLTTGSYNTQLRPFLKLLTRIPYYFTGDVIKSFEIMNYVYIFIFSLSLCLIIEIYNKNIFVKLFFLLNIFSCIAATKIFAFYPTLIDLGGYALINLAIYLIIIQKRFLSGLVCLLATLSREFAIAVPIIAFCRDLRTGSLKRETISPYLPSLGAFLLLRIWVKMTNVGINDLPMISLYDLLINGLQCLGDPVFIAFFIYFTLTIWGGISLILISQFAFCLKCLREEYEYAVFLGLILGVSALGSIDIWRYLAYSIPVVSVLFARYAGNLKIGQSSSIFLLSALGTLLTQQPFLSMNMDKYFVYWAPLYWIYRGDSLINQGISRPVNFEIIWLSLFVIALLIAWLLSQLHRQIQQKNVY